jgi:sigma-B regulation protein RsbU (phosphoserine phosphatase)
MGKTDIKCCLNAEHVLNSLNDGLYTVDTDRRILYWSKAAERITGWAPEDVIGRHCRDEVLCHVDKDGHQLCGEEHCPLHRAMVTKSGSTAPIIVFAKCKDGGRVPLRVSVAPVEDDTGEVVGGVETFRDLSDELQSIHRAQKIQSLTLEADLPEDERIAFSTHYVPCDVIGGDYYAVSQLNANCYGFMMADITGHGVAAALYTMYLSSLWDAHRHLLLQPMEFCRAVDETLCRLFKGTGPFAATLCGLIDLQSHTLRLIGAGSPPPLRIGTDGSIEVINCTGVPLGYLEDMPHDDVTVDLSEGDTVLMFSDGATEVSLGEKEYLDTTGLMEILKRLGYPQSGVSLETVEREILRSSDRIRFDDDLTFFEMRLT